MVFLIRLCVCVCPHVCHLEWDPVFEHCVLQTGMLTMRCLAAIPGLTLHRMCALPRSGGDDSDRPAGHDGESERIWPRDHHGQGP